MCALINVYVTVFSLTVYVCLNKLTHVLVCPRREVKRFIDLTSDETSDLWMSAQKVGAKLEQFHKASSLTLAIQVDFQETLPWFFLESVYRVIVAFSSFIKVLRLNY